MTFRLLLILPFLLYSCKLEKENKIKKNDLEQQGLHGKVKSTKDFITENKIKFCTLNKIYNLDGNLREIFQYDKQNLTVKTNFEYNENGLKTAENINFLLFRNYNNGRFYEYDKKGNLIIEKSYSRNPNMKITGTFKSIYNSAGEKIEETEYDDNGRKVSIKNFKYDAIGNLIESKQHNSEGLISIIKKEYDKKGNVIKYSVISTDVDTVTTTTYETKYDEFNNVIDEKVLDGNKTTHNKYLYKYDNQGNWINCIEICDNKLKNITERVIEYY